jgi:hypothetical protein
METGIYNQKCYIQPVTQPKMKYLLFTLNFNLNVCCHISCPSNKGFVRLDHWAILNISGDRALIPRQSKMCDQKHGGFLPNLHHFDYPASKVLSYFFSARHGEARETLQNLCLNSFEHARRLLSNCLFPRRRFNK